MKRIISSLFAIYSIGNAVLDLSGNVPLNCELTCNAPGQADCLSPCAVRNPSLIPTQTTLDITSPRLGWTMACTAYGSCAHSKININTAGGQLRQIDTIKISAPYAAYKATITVNNVGKVKEIECGARLCEQVSFVFVNSDYGDLKCEEYGGCGAGCTVTQHGVEVPCDQVSTT